MPNLLVRTAHAPQLDRIGVAPGQTRSTLGVSCSMLPSKLRARSTNPSKFTIEALQDVLFISTSKDPSISSASFALHLSCAASTASFDIKA